VSDYYLDHEIAARYDDETNGVPGDAEFYLALARETAAEGHSVLELACGTGRVAIPIAREGIPVTGLDASPAMLEIAREKTEGLPNLRLIEGDMAAFHLPERFGLICIPYRSFLLLPSVEAQKRCLACVHEHLVVGGRLALNIFNPDLIRLAEWLKTRQPHIGEGSKEEVGGGRRREAHSRDTYRTDVQEIESGTVAEEIDAAGGVVSRKEKRMKLRYVFRYEMEHLLALAGFDVEALYGDFYGAPFGETSTEMVWVARKA
jgi:SAM-dependent methyltransferase